MSDSLDILTDLLGTERAHLALEALNAAGWVVVPRIPTEAMLDAGWYEANVENAAGAWRDMIEAATTSTGRREAGAPLSAPLSGGAREVLRALVYGLDLREIEEEWAFVGYWQYPTRSGVAPSVMRELFGYGFISRCDESRAVITKTGEQALSRSTEAAFGAASKWFKERG